METAEILNRLVPPEQSADLARRAACFTAAEAPEATGLPAQCYRAERRTEAAVDLVRVRAQPMQRRARGQAAEAAEAALFGATRKTQAARLDAEERSL